MRISQLRTLAKTALSTNADYVLTANTTNGSNAKTLVNNFFPTITNYGSTTGAISLISAVANKNEFNLSKLVAGSTKLSITGGGGAADVSIDLGTVQFADITGTITNEQLAGLIDVTKKITGTLPIANGGTGSIATTYCTLTTNVTGTLPVANGGIGVTTLTDKGVLVGAGTGVVSGLTAGTNAQLLVGTTGSNPAFATPSATASISWGTAGGAISANVIGLPSLTGNIAWDAGANRTVQPTATSGVGDNLTLSGGNSSGSNSGGDLYLYAGTGGASDGGDIFIKAGTSATGGSKWGGDIRLQQQDGDTANITTMVRVYRNMIGISNDQGNLITPGANVAVLHVENSNTDTATMSVVNLEQNLTTGPFIKFTGTSDTDQTKSLSTDTSVGALTGHILVNVNGTEFWIPYYAQN